MEISGIRTHMTIGDLQVLRCPRLVIQSVRHRPLSRATITLPDPAGELYRAIATGDAVTIKLGYRDQTPATWTGSVRSWGRGATKDQIEIRVADTALPLVETRLTQAWENETAEAIIAYAIRQTGLAVGTISATGMVLPKVIASDVPVWQLVRQIAASCQRAFALDMSHWALWHGANGVNWGDFDEPGTVPVIATSAGLISHAPPLGDVWQGSVESLLQPGLMHSRQVAIKDQRRGIDASYRALDVIHTIEPTKARTRIYYGDENAWI